MLATFSTTRCRREVILLIDTVQPNIENKIRRDLKDHRCNLLNSIPAISYMHFISPKSHETYELKRRILAALDSSADIFRHGIKGRRNVQ